MTRTVMCLGTRPEAIKLAPVAIAAQANPAVDLRVVSLGQHVEACDEVMRFFDVPIDLRFSVMRPGQSLAALSAQCLTTAEGVMDLLTPQLLLVQGDTTSAAMAALAAFYAGVPVWHVEAGLRTSTPNRPFPEEMNRRLITRIASRHFAPTERAVRNLLAEGVEPDSVVLTGNTGIDALHAALQRRRSFENPSLAALIDERRRLLLVTMHRRENWGAPIRVVCEALSDLVARHPDLQVVFTTHINPAIRREVEAAFAGNPSVIVMPPIDYGDFVLLLSKAAVVLTDSGGIQEEAPSLGVPVLVARVESERVEGVDAGYAQIVGTDPVSIATAVDSLLVNGGTRSPDGTNPYGDGAAAERIVARIAAMTDPKSGLERTWQAPRRQLEEVQA